MRSVLFKVWEASDQSLDYCQGLAVVAGAMGWDADQAVGAEPSTSLYDRGTDLGEWEYENEWNWFFEGNDKETYICDWASSGVNCQGVVSRKALSRKYSALPNIGSGPESSRDCRENQAGAETSKHSQHWKRRINGWLLLWIRSQCWNTSRNIRCRSKPIAACDKYAKTHAKQQWDLVPEETSLPQSQYRQWKHHQRILCAIPRGEGPRCGRQGIIVAGHDEDWISEAQLWQYCGIDSSWSHEWCTEKHRWLQTLSWKPKQNHQLVQRPKQFSRSNQKATEHAHSPRQLQHTTSTPRKHYGLEPTPRSQQRPRLQEGSNSQPSA